jgi:hypothetical protein
MRLKPVGLPVDSVRPKPPRAVPLDPSRAPAVAPPPPAPHAATDAAPAAPTTTPSITPPLGATAQCKDGYWVMSAYNEAACSTHGGLLVVLPPPRETPRRPSP